ncbi:16S rRNA (cytosine(1402)-N(4))-methyltransferase RsmH [Polymorphobacter sp.]|uniref:16S rRNA (cytosine(1402)-N(4))-methyltransferase RsmH n=1 Tax=Polymorphobacter sp. TaxID=1909290 RepID=UPI003F6FFDC0
MSAHIPVLLDETMAALGLVPGDLYVDATLGAGGYLRAALGFGIAHAYGFDRDPEAIARNADLADREDVTLVHRPFSELEQGLAAHGVTQVDAIAFDIGVSSMQIDTPERGFSFQSDGPLDMRMSQSGPHAGASAADVVNTATEAELADILFHLGDEPGARRIARALVADRPFTRTSELARVIRSVLGHKPGAPRDPATRSFQALRIHVNDELGQLDAGLDAAERLLRPGGRLAVVSFHSAEDRRVKNFLRERSGNQPAGSRHQPETLRPRAASFARPARAVRPGARELATNPRARSATLRSAVRTNAAAWAAAAGSVA